MIQRKSNFVLIVMLLAMSQWSPMVYAAEETQQPVAPISDQEFAELHSSLVPKNALWKTVPWETALLKAQNMAARQGKPIFIWSMDGHPLGCT